MINMGKFHGGTMRNILAGSVRNERTMRGYDSRNCRASAGMYTDIADDISKKTGQFNLHFSAGYPPVLNDAEHMRRSPVLEEKVW